MIGCNVGERLLQGEIVTISDMEYTDFTNDCPGSIKRRRCKCE